MTFSPLQRLTATDSRRVAGIMSGTSLDGVDVVIADLSGTGRAMTQDVVAARFYPYPTDLAALLLANSSPATSSVLDISQLGFRLAAHYADCVLRTCNDSGIPLDTIDLVGCHGQTVFHVPDPAVCAGHPTTSTLQIGDGSVLASLLGLPVVSNFRAADMAMGGQGAPLVPYFDYIRFTDAAENRVLLNLGGIANLTVLKADGQPENVVAFDTGPANMLMNYIAARRLGKAWDEDGRAAAAGTANSAVVAEFLRDEYYTRTPPKSTGRELYTESFADRFESSMRATEDNSPEAAMATALMITVETIALAMERFVLPSVSVDRLLASGGGVRNTELMRRLSERLSPLPVESLTTQGVDADFKEALCFAVLAHEFVNGTPANLPSVTGASGPALLGELALAPHHQK